MGVRGITEGAVPFEECVKASQTREKADEFGVHRLQNDLRDARGTEAKREVTKMLSADNYYLGTMDSRLGKGV